MNHLLRAAYCIDDELLEGGAAKSCPKESTQWTPWWDIGEFGSFVSSKVERQHGDNVMDFYRKYINPEYNGDEIMAFFPTRCTVCRVQRDDPRPSKEGL